MASVNVIRTPANSTVPPLFAAWAGSSVSPLPASQPRSSTCATTGQSNRCRDGDGVADVVAVAVGQDDEVAALGLALDSGHDGFPVRNGST